MKKKAAARRGKASEGSSFPLHSSFGPLGNPEASANSNSNLYKRARVVLPALHENWGPCFIEKSPMALNDQYQAHMAQKPMLRVEVGARELRVRSARAPCLACIA